MVEPRALRAHLDHRQLVAQGQVLLPGEPPEAPLQRAEVGRVEGVAEAQQHELRQAALERHAPQGLEGAGQGDAAVEHLETPRDLQALQLPLETFGSRLMYKIHIQQKLYIYIY